MTASWSVMPSLDQGTNTNHLLGVSCLSSSDCGAVGHYSNGSVDQTLTEHYGVSPSDALPDVPWVPAVALVGAAAAFMRLRARKLAQSGI